MPFALSSLSRRDRVLKINSHPKRLLWPVATALIAVSLAIGLVSVPLNATSVFAATGHAGATPSPTPSTSQNHPVTSGAIDVQIVAASALTIVTTEALTFNVNISNHTHASLKAGEIEFGRTDENLSHAVDVDRWRKATLSDLPASITIAKVPVSEVPAGETVVVSIGLEPNALAVLAGSVDAGLVARYTESSGTGATALGTALFGVDSAVPVASSTPLLVAYPLTAPVDDAGTDLLSADRLAELTSPSGELTKDLDAVASSGVAVGLDPRIVASIRSLDPTVQSTAKPWLERLAALPNVKFPLQYADADVSSLSSLRRQKLPSVSFADFAGANESAEDKSAALLSFPYSRTDIVWPGPGTVKPGDLNYLKDQGAKTVLLTPENIKDENGDSAGDRLNSGASRTIDDSSALVSDAVLGPMFEAAVQASDDQSWRRAVASIQAELALRTVFNGGAAPALVLLPRMTGGSGKLGQTFRELLRTSWFHEISFDGLTRLDPPTAELKTAESNQTRDNLVSNSALAVDKVALIASTTTAPDKVSAATTREWFDLISTHDLANSTGGVSDEHNDGVTPEYVVSSSAQTWLHKTEELASAVDVVSSSKVNVVSRETGVPVTLSNDLNAPATVVLSVIPTNRRLVVKESLSVTIQASSRKTVLVPVEAGIGNGSVGLRVELFNSSGERLGHSALITANVRADWEGLGALIIGGFVLLVFVFGIIRNIRRRANARTVNPSGAAGE